jgi:hypothetical protein
MIDEYGIDDKRDKSRGIKRVISGFRIKNSRMIVSAGMVSFVGRQSEFCAAGVRYLTQECRNKPRRSWDNDLKEEISKAIKSKPLLVLKDPWHPRERRNSRRGKGIRLIKLPQMDRWPQYRTRRYHQAKFRGLVGVWKIASPREFEQHQCQRLGE